MSGSVITNIHGIDLHRGGRRRPIVTAESHPHLFRGAHLYAKTQHEEAPDYDYFAACQAAQSDILGNADKGDCTAAGALHLDEVYTANAGDPVVFDTAAAIRFYSLSTGYVDGDPSTDQGGDEITVLTKWRDVGLDGKGNHRILGWLVADPTKPAEIKWLGYVFEGLYYGAELDKNWPDQVQGNGFTWSDGTPDPDEGHCFVSAKATGSGTALRMGINSWGFLGEITQPCQAKFCVASAGGNILVPVSAEIIKRATQRAPNGFAYDDLLADMKALGGGDTMASDAPAAVAPGHVQVQVPANAPVGNAPSSDAPPPSSSPTIEAKEASDIEEKGPSTQPAGAQAPAPQDGPTVPPENPNFSTWDALEANAVQARVKAGYTGDEAYAWVDSRLEAIGLAAKARKENGEPKNETDAFVTGELQRLVVEASSAAPTPPAAAPAAARASAPAPAPVVLGPGDILPVDPETRRFLQDFENRRVRAAAAAASKR